MATTVVLGTETSRYLTTYRNAERTIEPHVMGLLQLRYEHDSSTIRVRFEHDSATTRYEVFRALAYEIVYENQW